MQAMYEWGLQVIRAVQSIENPFVTTIFKAITFLGEPIPAVFALLITFWCIDQQKGFRLGFFVILNTQINITIKNALQVPRPYILDESVGMMTVSGFSTPSGHAQGSIVLFGMIVYLFYAAWKNAKFVLLQKNSKLLLWIIGFFLPFAIGFSRIYLGVHFPTDVLLGWILGGILLIFGTIVWNLARPLFIKIPKSFQILILAALIFLLNAFSPQQRILSGILFGFAAGYVYLSNKNSFSAASKSVQQKIPRIFLGLSGVALCFLLILALKKYSPLLFFACFLLGLWISYFAPLLFVKFGLASSNQLQEKENA